eukprot:m.569475 g.569475  ORF g.569475 m.569475 type:complete len:227 (-) comp22260_c0_seq12:272-952(-)
MSQKQGAASSTPNRARSDTKSALEASPHVSTKTTPHVSSPLIPKSTPSSARKSKRKTIEEDLVPERPHGEHIFSLDQKDVNLATLSCPSVFGMAAAWMRNDPCGEHSTTRTSRSALAGLTLPEPAAAQHSPRPTKHPRGIHRHASSVELRLDAVLDALEAAREVPGAPSATALLADHQQRWRASLAAKHAAKNRSNAERYAASIEMIVSDQTDHPAMPITATDSHP